ncbi:MAG: radical SAM protein [Victivallaceae bacterium]
MNFPNRVYHLFGPVPSRRLGRSLGIDTMPHKVCSFDCVYCQLGKTTVKTLERKEYVPYDEIISDLDRYLTINRDFDYITFSGSGEPTLHNRIGELIEAVKKRTDKPVAVLTNGSMLWDASVRDELLPADLVLPSLDAGNQDFFEKINRPCPGLVFEHVADGLEKFSRQFKGEIWLEVFLIGGILDPYLQAETLSGLTRKIAPTRIQLNTAVRPPCESKVKPVSRANMTELLKYFPASAEVVADYSAILHNEKKQAERDDILNLLLRRPCTSEDIAGSLSVHHIETLKILEELVAENLVRVTNENGKNFYRGIITNNSDGE